jgi:large subunit ribosomal protein L5
MIPRLKDKYVKEVVPALREQFKYANVMQIPKLQKIVLNIGVGEAIKEPKVLELAMENLSTITGQKPLVRKARKSIAQFRLREGMSIGAAVTLRNNMMYEFLDRFISLTIPRIRDFRGLNPDAFDGHGNYSMGVREQIIFPEINYDKIDRVLGINITFVTTAKTDEECFELLAKMGMPFRQTRAVS